MRIWRDVISLKTFKLVRQAYEDRIRSDNLASAQSKERNISRNRSGNASPPVKPLSLALNEVETALDNYHKLKKTDLNTYDERIRRLGELSRIAAQCINSLGFSASDLETRAIYTDEFGNSVTGKDARTGVYMFGDAKKESLARNLLTLKRRSLRKADYIARLQNHYKSNLDTPDSIMNLLTKSRRTDKLVGLMPGVRLEQYDFMHRPFEVTIEEGEIKQEIAGSAISAALMSWMGSPKSNATPFFCWLESHAVCTGEDKSKNETREVSYQDSAGNRSGKTDKLCVVTFESCMRMIPLGAGVSSTDIADTASYMAASGKSIDGPKDGRGLAAFVFTEKKELLISEHVEAGFHHSSFVSGNPVRCAGMIKIEGGKVTQISNNSGHYKPPASNLKDLVERLHMKQCLRDDAVVQVCGSRDVSGNTPVISYKHFLKYWHKF